MQRRLPIHPSGGKRPLGGAPHLRVDVGLVPLVERAACAGAERDAQDRGEAEHQRRKLAARRAGRTGPVNTTRLITRGLVSARMSRQSAGSAAGLVISMVGIGAAYKGLAAKRKTRLASSSRHAASSRPCSRDASRSRSSPLSAQRSPGAPSAPERYRCGDVRPGAGRDRHQPRPDRRRARPAARADHRRQLPPLCRHPPLRRRDLLPRRAHRRRRTDPGRVRSDARKLFPPIAHESDGARPACKCRRRDRHGAMLGPGTAQADFFILRQRHPGIDAGAPTAMPTASRSSARSSRAWTW